jgi:hypothetical protein
VTLGGTSVDRGAVLTFRQARVRLSAANQPRTLKSSARTTLSGICGIDERDLNTLKSTLMHVTANERAAVGFMLLVQRA